MKTQINIHDFSKHIFWDVDMNKFDIHVNKEQLTYKVLEYGQLSDWKKLLELYGAEKVKELVVNLRSLECTTLSFLCFYFNLDKNSF